MEIRFLHPRCRQWWKWNPPYLGRRPEWNGPCHFFARLRNAVLLAACCDRSLLVSASGRLIYSSGTSQSWQRWNLWPFSGAGLPYRRIGAFKTTSAASSGTDPASEVCAKASRSSFFFWRRGIRFGLSHVSTYTSTASLLSQINGCPSSRIRIRSWHNAEDYGTERKAIVLLTSKTKPLPPSQPVVPQTYFHRRSWRSGRHGCFSVNASCI